MFLRSYCKKRKLYVAETLTRDAARNLDWRENLSRCYRVQNIKLRKLCDSNVYFTNEIEGNTKWHFKSFLKNDCYVFLIQAVSKLGIAKTYDISGDFVKVLPQFLLKLKFTKFSFFSILHWVLFVWCIVSFYEFYEIFYSLLSPRSICYGCA